MNDEQEKREQAHKLLDHLANFVGWQSAIEALETIAKVDGFMERDGEQLQ
jgi:hypothetical protein